MQSNDITDQLDHDQPSVIMSLADTYGITIISAEENARCNGAYPNQMASAGSMIFLNEFDDPDIELAAFFHELGQAELTKGDRNFSVALFICDKYFIF